MYRPLLTALLLAATIPAAAQHTLRGRALEGGSPVGYATAVLLRDGRQAAGTTTDDAGSFVLTADTGRYTLVLRHVAYRPFEQEVCVAAADTDLGDLPLTPLGISEVTVTAETITRQADRFVVNIGDMIWVKVTDIDEKGRVNLSYRDALKEIKAKKEAGEPIK